MSAEQWRPANGFEGVYEVSSLGRVRSLTHTIRRADGGEWTYRGRVLKAGPTTKGYLFVTFSRGAERHMRKVHRLVLEAFVGPCPEGMEGCHNDGDKTNNQISNLRWDTRSANAKDRVKHGTQNSFTARERTAA